MNENCYGRTVSGSPCELPAGHGGHHLRRIGPGDSWIAWTDQSMAEFARIANEKFNAEHPEHGVEERRTVHGDQAG